MINNISTKVLAEFLGTTQGWITHIKSGRRKIPPKDCIRVSKHFSIPLHELRPDIYPNPDDELSKDTLLPSQPPEATNPPS